MRQEMHTSAKQGTEPWVLYKANTCYVMEMGNPIQCEAP